MKDIRRLHEEAMDLTEKAVLAARKGQDKEGSKLTSKAFSLEREAAEHAVQRNAPEPTRSVLLRSAATLALQCGDYREAEKLVSIALAGEPPPEIADELRDLLEDINFSRHLDLKGISLQEDEVQLSIAGNEVGYGVAPSDEFVHRVDALKKLVYRTAERTEGRPYRETAAPAPDIKKDYQFFISALRAASLAVTIKIGRSKEQLELNPHPARNVLDEVLGALEEFDTGNEKHLRKRIRDEAYYKNFVGLAKEIVPTGDSVRQVGLTVMRQGTERRIVLKRPRSQAAPEKKTTPKLKRGQSINIRGELRFASALEEHKDLIKISGEDGVVHTIRVPEGMMSDIVKPLWGEWVKIRAKRSKGSVFELEDIERDENNKSESLADQT